MRAQLAGMTGIVEDLASAIERMEGTGCGRGRNNPGNLRSWGDLPTSGGFAVFPTCDAGRRALQHQVQRNIDRGLTLQEFFGGKAGVYPGYAPAADSNDPYHYARSVSQWTGLPIDIPLSQIGSGHAPGRNDSPLANDDNTALLAAGIIGALAIALL